MRRCTFAHGIRRLRHLLGILKWVSAIELVSARTTSVRIVVVVVGRATSTCLGTTHKISRQEAGTTAKKDEGPYTRSNSGSHAIVVHLGKMGLFRGIFRLLIQPVQPIDVRLLRRTVRAGSDEEGILDDGSEGVEDGGLLLSAVEVARVVIVGAVHGGGKVEGASIVEEETAETGRLILFGASGAGRTLGKILRFLRKYLLLHFEGTRGNVIRQ